MFDSIKSVCKNVKRLNPDRLFKEVFEDRDIQQDIINLNKEQMYEEGIDSKSESLGEYSPHTKQIKIEKGQRYDHITLKDTGEFYDSIKITNVRTGQFTIKGDMIKPDTNLETIYPNALGLTDENLSVISSLVAPIFREKVLRNIYA